MKTYILSAHAEIVMTERSIKREWLDRVLAHPELVEKDRGDPDLLMRWVKFLSMVGAC